MSALPSVASGHAELVAATAAPGTGCRVDALEMNGKVVLNG